MVANSKRWRLLHSLWIGWTFTLGFLSWIAFAYIGIRARHQRWILWALFYAAPLILFAILAGAPDVWTNVTLSAAVVLGVVSIVHAFLIRKEYLLRLELLQQETNNVTATSNGRRWEILHSLWMVWTFTLGLLSWVAFLYVGLRVRQPRWLLWGLLYSVPFVAYLITSVIAPGSMLEETMIGVVIIAGFFSIVHAFLIRNDYLVRLVNQSEQDFDKEIILPRRPPTARRI
jgi:positive regulator of sigma E activity